MRTILYTTDVHHLDRIDELLDLLRDLFDLFPRPKGHEVDLIDARILRAPADDAFDVVTSRRQQPGRGADKSV